MYSLERIEVDKFNISQAVSLDKLEENKNNQEFLNSSILGMEDIFRALPKINLDIREKELFLNGVKLKFNLEDGLYNIYLEKYIGLGIVENGLLKRDVVEKEKIGVDELF